MLCRRRLGCPQTAILSDTEREAEPFGEGDARLPLQLSFPAVVTHSISLALIPPEYVTGRFSDTIQKRFAVALVHVGVEFFSGSTQQKGIEAEMWG